MNNNTELLELQDRYNRICNELKQLISSVLESGKKTPEEAVRLSQLQEEEQILYAELKQLGLLSNQLDKKAIIDILTDYGQSTLLKLEEDGSITIGGDKIPQLTLLAKTIDLIARANDEQSKIELTPEFIEMVVEQTGSSDGIKDVLTKYYLSTSTTELIGGNWLDTLPSTDEQEGKYLWYKMVTIYSDPNKEPKETDPICIAAQSGTTTYTWIRYADDVNGNGISNDPTGKKYIGFAYNKTTAIESNIPSDYTWSLIQGEKGDTGVPGATGEDGKTYYTWIRYSDNVYCTYMYDIPKVFF